VAYLWQHGTMRDNTNIWFYAFPQFRKEGKFEAFIKRPKAVFQLQGPLDQGLCLWTPLGALPQTAVMGSRLMLEN